MTTPCTERPLSAAAQKAILEKHLPTVTPPGAEVRSAEVRSADGKSSFSIQFDGLQYHVRVYAGRMNTHRLTFSADGNGYEGIDFTAPSGCGDLTCVREPWQIALRAIDAIPSAATPNVTLNVPSLPTTET